MAFQMDKNYPFYKTEPKFYAIRVKAYTCVFFNLLSVFVRITTHLQQHKNVVDGKNHNEESTAGDVQPEKDTNRAKKYLDASLDFR